LPIVVAIPVHVPNGPGKYLGKSDEKKSINTTPVSEMTQMSLVCITLVFPPKDPHMNIAKTNLRFLALVAYCRLLNCGTR
jgi:hypothetical protein